MQVVQFKRKAQTLAEHLGWPLESAEGYVDGEGFRRRRRDPPENFLVGIDDYSLGFRAGFYGRPLSERAREA
jgi:hypothetical protein